MRLFRCNIFKNLMFVLVLLALVNILFMVYSMFSTNLNPGEERVTARRYFSLSNDWNTRIRLSGEEIGSILDQLSHGPLVPVFLYKAVCRSGSCARYSGIELKKVFKENGFDIVDKSNKEWTVAFTNGVSGVPKVTKVWQYTNLVPGIGDMCIREKLCLQLEKFPHQNDLRVFAAFPKCFVLQQNKSLELQIDSLPKGYWLLRKAGTLRGSSDGLIILRRDNILKKLKQTKDLLLERNKAGKSLYQTRSLTTIEQYIHEPLLINKRKHVLQLYLLVKSLDPLRVYMSDFGYVTFAQMSYRFEKEAHGKNDSCMHLDFYTASWCAQKMDSPGTAWQVNGKNSLVWTLEHYWSELSKLNIDTSYLISEIQDALLQTAILLASTSLEIIKRDYVNERPRFLALKKNGFVIFHAKILMDKMRKAHVVDIDCDPGLKTLGSDSFRSRQMVTLIQDLIKLSGSFRGKYDRMPYKEKLTDNLLSFCGNCGGCSEEEMRTIVVYEDERHNSGHFQLIYPHPTTVNSHRMTIKDLKLESVLTEYIDQIRKF